MKKILVFTIALTFLLSCTKEQTKLAATAKVENLNNFWQVRIKFDTAPNIGGLVKFYWIVDGVKDKHFGICEFPKQGENEIIYQSDIAAFKAETAKVVYLEGKSLDNQLKVIQK